MILSSVNEQFQFPRRPLSTLSVESVSTFDESFAHDK
jgi:hypothetical protein